MRTKPTKTPEADSLLGGRTRKRHKQKVKQMRGRGTRMSVTHPDGTRVEVRHMSASSNDDGERLYLFYGVDRASGQGDGPVWIQLAKSGTFHGHAQGAFRLDARVFDTLIKNFKSNPDGKVPIDFEHASELPPTSGSVPAAGAPAQGWILDLKQDGANLFALVQWGELARQYIREQKYQFISPAIRFKAKDPQSGLDIGPALTSAGLTNTPFLRGMMPLVASENAAQHASAQASAVLASGSFCYSSSEYMPAIKAALRLPELCTATQCSEHLDMLREHLAAAGGNHMAAPQGVQLSDYLLPLRNIARAPMNVSWEQVFDLVQDLIDAAIDEHEIAQHGAEDASMSDEEGTETLLTTEQPGAAPVATQEQSSEAATPASAESTTQETITMSQPIQPAAPVAPAAPPAATPAPAAAAPAATTAAPVTEASAEVMTMSLRMRGLETENARLLSELNDLRSWKLQREQQDAGTEVAIAYETYRDSKGLKPEDQATMLSVLQSNPEAFRKLYPPVPAGQRHLLSNLTGGSSSNPSGANPQARVPADSPAAPASTVTMSLRQLSHAIARKKGIPLGQAQIEADQIIRQQRASGMR